MKVAAADLSIAKSGLARVDGTLATIKPTSKGYARLRPLAGAILSELLHADLVILEGYDPHPRGALALIRAAELGGMVRAGLEELAVAWLDVPPSVLKKYATGKGNAPKDAVTLAAIAAGATLSSSSADDEADAYWLRRVGIELLETAGGHPPRDALADFATKHAGTLDRVRARCI